MSVNVLTDSEYRKIMSDFFQKRKEAEMNRVKTGNKYTLKIYDIETDSEEIYLEDQDIQKQFMDNGLKIEGNFVTLSGFYYGSSSAHAEIGTLIEVEHDTKPVKINYKGEEKEVSDYFIKNIEKKGKILKLFLNDELIDEVRLDENTKYEYTNIGAYQVLFTNRHLKSVLLRELYKYPSFVDQTNPLHRKIPHELSSISFVL